MIDEIEIARWLNNHSMVLQEKLHSLYRPAYHLFPEAMKEIYFQQYRDGALRIIRGEAMSELGLNGEEALITLDENFVNKVNNKLLKQPE